LAVNVTFPLSQTTFTAGADGFADLAGVTAGPAGEDELLAGICVVSDELTLVSPLQASNFATLTLRPLISRAP